MTPDSLAARLLATFIDELEEQRVALDAALLALERDPADEEQLHVVFRVMHTLKGAARAAGVGPVEELCHALESELAASRDARRALDGGQIAQLFAASDVLGESARALRAGTPVPAGALAAVLRQRPAAPARPERPAPNERAAPRERTAAPDERAALPDKPGPASEAPSLARATAVSPSAPPSAPAPPSPPNDAAATAQAAAARGGVRVGVRRLDALVAAAGELLGAAGSLGERPRELGALRDTLLRAGDPAVRAAGRELARLAHRAEDDARAVGAMAGRFLDAVRGLRLRAFGEIAEGLPRVARDVAASTGKSARVVIEGEDVEADRAVLEALREPLVHLVRNAVDHGLESPDERVRAGKPTEGTITVRAALRGDRLVVSVSDDGAGVNLAAVRASLARRGIPAPDDEHALLDTLFTEGFSTRREATAISGRGVGLGIVRAAAARHGGTVEVRRPAGGGTSFLIELPVSVATIRVLLVALGEHRLAIPTSAVVRSVRIARDAVREADGRSLLAGGADGAPIPLVSLARVLGAPYAEPADAASARVRRAVIVAWGTRRAAFVVDDVVEERELVMRPLDQGADMASPLVAGAAVLGDGRVTLLLDVQALLADALRAGAGPDLAIHAAAEARRPHVLVVDDSITTRTLEESVLAAAGYDVTTAVDGAQAWRIIEGGGIDVVVSDIEMPNMTGVELCARVRATKRTASLPVVLVTSLDQPAQRAAGLEAGADAYITKSSFDQDTLLDIVRQLAGRAR